jgi:hypothetical protein
MSHRFQPTRGIDRRIAIRFDIRQRETDLGAVHSTVQIWSAGRRNQWQREAANIVSQRLLQIQLARMFTPARLLERRQSCHSLTDDERVNVVRALVRVHTLEIFHVTHRTVLGEYAVAAKHPPRLARDIARNVHVVTLRKRYLLRRALPRILQPAELKDE